MIRVFISHSRKDAELAILIAELLSEGLEFGKKEIRCTSAPGYKLEAGTHVSATLKSELRNCKVVIGVLTSNSVISNAVLMELGAGWGLEKRLVSVLGPKFDFQDLPQWLAELHAMKWNDEDSWEQLANSLSKELGVGINIRQFSNRVGRLVSYGTPTETVQAVLPYPPITQPRELRQLDAHACSDEPNLRSLSFDVKTTLMFKNATAQPVRLYWIDYTGARKLYFTLQPGDTISQDTFLTHPFVLTDLNDKCLGIYLPSKEPSVAILRDDRS